MLYNNFKVLYKKYLFRSTISINRHPFFKTIMVFYFTYLDTQVCWKVEFERMPRFEGIEMC